MKSTNWVFDLIPSRLLALNQLEKNQFSEDKESFWQVCKAW